jgi:hypothetical protein
MYTILFYSYKGGSGRSLLLANFAVCLARLGRTAAVLDLDLSAPGLQYKFKKFTGKEKPAQGVLDYMQDFIDKRAQGLQQKFDPNSISQYVMPIPMPKSEARRRPYGAIHLLPAGDIFAKNYIRKLAGGRWWELLTFQREWRAKKLAPDDALRDRETSLSNLSFFKSMHNAIATLDPKPDFLLVDLRSGISEMEGMCIRTWANMVVCLFACNDEGKACVGKVLRTIRKIKRGESPLRTTVVLTRIAPLMDLQIGPLRDQLRRELRLEKGDRVHVIHSDRRLEFVEQLTFDLEEDPKNTLLAQDHVELFAHFLAAEKGKITQKAIEEAAQDLRDEFGLPDRVKIVERFFTLYLNRGEMLNPHDGSRNVAFKVETFVNLLKDIFDGISGQEGGAGGVGLSRLHTAIRTGGFQCGKRFGHEVVRVWKEALFGESAEKGDGAPISDREKITRWCDFDSDVGWGRFTPLVRECREERVISGEIRLYNSFLVTQEDKTEGKEGSKVASEKVDLCRFMWGYIEGVLSVLLSPEIEVKMHETCLRRGGAYCGFEFGPRGVSEKSGV